VNLILLLSLLGAGLALPAAGPSSPADTLMLSMERAIAMAQQQNRDLLIADQDRVKAKAQIGEAKSGAFPQINVAGTYTRNIKKPVMFLPPHNPINPTDETQAFEIGSNNAYLASVQLSQTLFNRRVGVALDIAHTYRDLSEESYESTFQTVVRDVRKSFYQILLAKKLLEANRQGLEVVKSNFDNLQSQYNVGAAAEFDLLRAEVQLANTEPLVISAENNYQLAVNALKNILSIPLQQPVSIEGELAFEDIPAEEMVLAREEALKKNTLIRQIALQERLLDKNIQVEKAGLFPNLYMTGAYSWQSQDNTYSFNQYNWANPISIGLSLSYPLFDGFRTRQRVQQATVEYNKVHYTLLKVEEALTVQIQATELRMQEARKRMAGQEKNIEQAQKAVHIAQTRYKSGVGTQLELLDAQVAMTRSQTNYAQALYDYLVAKTEWQYATGISR